jgi:GTP-binding protein HflX
LQIFAKRAKTGLARLQIELAFINFLKTKLVRDGNTFSGMFNIFGGDLMTAKEIKLEVVSAKQKGGTQSMSGAGETQLEIERRILSDKEAKIKREIMAENNQRQVRRDKKRESLNTIPHIALIGYTNAGKSKIMNRLAKAGVVSDDKLFQTLHTTSKKMKLKSGQMGILLDTIGFISNLPHELIESFKCTLEEVQDADLVLHVRDISHPNTKDQKDTVMEVLKELGFDQQFYTKRMIEVWNKIDLITQPLDLEEIKKSPIPVLPISALKGTNCGRLLKLITDKSNEVMGKKSYRIVNPAESHGERLRWLVKHGNLPEIADFEYDYNKTTEFPHGSISFDVCIDDTTHRRFRSTFNPVEKNKNDVKIPDEWLKNSKSYFEKKNETPKIPKSKGSKDQ